MPSETKRQAAALVARYGAEALEHLREAETMLTMVAAVGQLEDFAWGGQAKEWQRAVQSVVAQVEDTDLSGEQEPDYKAMPTREAIACAARAQRTVSLVVQRKDGAREEVVFEPYSIKDSRAGRRGEYLYCYNVDHGHIECLELDRILYLTGVGEEFDPRWDIEF